jgi:serine/threonine-protein kinase
MQQPAEVIAQARAAATRALEIDPSLGEAHCSLGLMIAIYDWNWREAEAHFRRALDLNPGYATTHHWLAIDFLPIFGRLEEAMREIEIAMALDPLSPIIAEGKAFLLMMQGQYEKSEALFRAMMDANPSHHRNYSALGRLLIQCGRYEEAIQMLERALGIAGSLPTFLGAMGQACGLAGHVSRAREILARLESMRSRNYAPATSLALTCIGLGQREQALTWLEEAANRREPGVVRIGTHPAYDALRGHPRFEHLVSRRLGLTLNTSASSQSVS